MSLTSRTALRFALAPAALFAAACSGDGATGPQANLTPAEAAEVVEALSLVSGLGFGFPAAARQALTADSPEQVADLIASVTESIDESVPCPVSGTTRINGSITINETTGASSADFRQTYTNCGVTAESGRLWTFQGDPNIRLRFSTTVNPATEQFTLTGSQVGAFTFSSAGNSGRCTVNLQMALTEVGITISGSVCGTAVSETISFGI